VTRVFVAGASGAIGRPLVRRLVEAGHQVTGMTRRPERAQELEAAGAEAVVCDVFDLRALNEGVADAAPEVMVHQLTALPQRFDASKPDIYDETNRLRIEGTANLIAAARAVGVRRLVSQSVSFLYAPTGSWVKSEDAEPVRDAPGHFGGAMDAVLDSERQVRRADGLEGIVLRYGFFYGPGTAYAKDGYWAEEARRRRLPVIGRGEGMASFIHVEDAASATVAAVERGAPGVYNIVDDEPARLRDWAPVFAAAVGAGRPLRIPAFVARLVGGRALVEMAQTSRAASNAKAKRELGWEPSIASWREGFQTALA
jgi:nucleoside-diphosphate-sugar epimerase